MTEPTALYRLFDENDALLYVGITCKPPVRFSQHKSQKPWWPSVTRKEIEWMSSWGDAERAEEEAIRQESPRWNIARPRPHVLTPEAHVPSAEDLALMSAIVEALREAVQRRQQHDEGAARARTDIDKLVLELLKQDPTRDREEIAEIAEVSPAKVREIARTGKIPPLKRGGRGRRVTKG